jgi:hypothetical protein
VAIISEWFHVSIQNHVTEIFVLEMHLITKSTNLHGYSCFLNWQMPRVAIKLLSFSILVAWIKSLTRIPWKLPWHMHIKKNYIKKNCGHHFRVISCIYTEPCYRNICFVSLLIYFSRKKYSFCRKNVKRCNTTKPGNELKESTIKY